MYSKVEEHQQDILKGRGKRPACGLPSFPHDPAEGYTHWAIGYSGLQGLLPVFNNKFCPRPEKLYCVSEDFRGFQRIWISWKKFCWKIHHQPSKPLKSRYIVEILSSEYYWIKLFSQILNSFTEELSAHGSPILMLIIFLTSMIRKIVGYWIQNKKERHLDFFSKGEYERNIWLWKSLSLTVLRLNTQSYNFSWRIYMNSI